MPPGAGPPEVHVRSTGGPALLAGVLPVLAAGLPLRGRPRVLAGGCSPAAPLLLLLLALGGSCGSLCSTAAFLAALQGLMRCEPVSR
jgi:hypothetical protein